MKSEGKTGSIKGFPSKCSSWRTSKDFWNILWLSILLHPRFSLANEGNPTIFFIYLILLFLRFNSTRHFSSGKSSVSIKLLLRFKILSEVSLVSPLVSRIRLSCRSSVSRFVRFSRFLMFLIWLFPKLSYLKPDKLLEGYQKQLISVNLFELKSRTCRFGRLTRWSIFLMLLLESMSTLMASSPSSSGTDWRFLWSRTIFSGLAYRSNGRR